MKRLVLIKSHTNPVIAHIYEHIFCYALEEFFLKNHMFTYIDYSYGAVTYRSGLIHITINLFTTEAQKISDEIRSITPSFDEDTVSVAILEIMAEKQIKIDGDYQKLEGQLRKLHQLNWDEVNEVGFRDDIKRKRSHGVADEYDASGSDFREMKITADLNSVTVNSPRETSLPLFHIIAEAILNNLSDLLARDYAYHGYESYTTNYTASKTAMTRKYRVHKKQIDRLTTEIEDSEQLIDDMLEHGFIDKVIDYLSSVSYSAPLKAPDEMSLYEQSGILIGAKGWATLADEKLIKAVMNNLSITFQLGKNKITIKSLQLK